MDTLTSMTVFRAVVELKSFAAAARRLELSPAMVTKHVMHLETRLKTRLLNRTSRHLSLTETGTLYFEQTKNTLDDLQAVEAAVTRSTVAASGLLKITAPAWMANPRFVNLLARYQAAYPDVRLDVDLSGRQVNLVDEGFDLALRAAPKLANTLIARSLGKVPFYWVASPTYLKRRGIPIDAKQLVDHSMLIYSLMPLADGLIFTGPSGRQAVQVAPTLLCNTETLLHRAALEDMGIAGLPLWLIDEDLRLGHLKRVLPQYKPFAAEIFGVYPSRKYLSSKVRTFLDFMDVHFEA
jgi:DNA-binding transcriptional LysR family regulator